MLTLSLSTYTYHYCAPTPETDEFTNQLSIMLSTLMYICMLHTNSIVVQWLMVEIKKKSVVNCVHVYTVRMKLVTVSQASKYIIATL